MRMWCELISRRLMFRTNGVKFGVKFFVATMVLSSAGLLYTAAQGRAQDNASGEVKDHGGRKIKTSVKPDYPQIARQMRVTGTVRLEATVAADGKVRDTKVIGGSPLLVQEAVTAVKKWKYEEATKESVENVEVVFQ
jgi:TonB family protein